MEEKKNIFKFSDRLFTTFGIMIILFIVPKLLFGTIGEGYSTLFDYGNKALSIATIFQLFGLSLIITVARTLFFSDTLFKAMPMIVRMVVFFAVITLFVILFVVFFRWFPIDDLKAWIGFIVSFILSTCAAVIIAKIRENSENDKMNKALEKYRSGNDC